MIILQTNGLSKNYGSLQAVNNLDFKVQEGSVFGILGPNGSGKTSTLSMILGIINPNAGGFNWFEGKYNNPLLKIGALLETPNFYPYLNAEDNLAIIAHIKKSKTDDFEVILKKVGLWEKKQLPFKAYSFGMKQRLAIGATMIGNPDVYIFDEPTNGLDPNGIADMRNVIKELHAEGKTIIMASHMLDEVEKVCTEVIIIKNGVKLSQDTVGHLTKTGRVIEIKSKDSHRLLELLQSASFSLGSKIENDLISINIADETPIEDISQYLMQNNISVSHFSEKVQRLEDSFIQITKNK
jgi:ABC-2 type transport system ATP-binding protein